MESQVPKVQFHESNDKLPLPTLKSFCNGKKLSRINLFTWELFARVDCFHVNFSPRFFFLRCTQRTIWKSFSSQFNSDMIKLIRPDCISFIELFPWEFTLTLIFRLLNFTLYCSELKMVDFYLSRIRSSLNNLSIAVNRNWQFFPNVR